MIYNHLNSREVCLNLNQGHDFWVAGVHQLNFHLLVICIKTLFKTWIKIISLVRSEVHPFSRFMVSIQNPPQTQLWRFFLYPLLNVLKWNKWHCDELVKFFSLDEINIRDIWKIDNARLHFTRLLTPTATPYTTDFHQHALLLQYKRLIKSLLRANLPMNKPLICNDMYHP